MTNPVGRPPIEIDDELIEQAEAYAMRGLTQEQIALALGMQPGTFYEKKAKYPEFSDAIKRGKAKGVAHVANQLLRNIDNANVTAQIFYLKTQAGWKEAQTLEHTGKDGEAIKFETKYKTDAHAKLTDIVNNALKDDKEDGI